MKEHVIINLDRTVNVPESMKKIGIQYDHNVKTITFDCPRYPDENPSVDMSTMKIFINWMLPDKTLGSTIATNVCVDSENENLMHFDWVITRVVTSVSGVLSTLICIKETTETGEETYHWNTELIQSFKVGNGMECTEQIVEQNIDVITQLLVQMDAVNTRTSLDETLTDSTKAAPADLVGKLKSDIEQLKQSGGTSEEEIRHAVEDYLTENPIDESDPTVFDWAKQPEKPTYTASEVGALPVGTKIPSKTSDLQNDSGFLTYHQDLSDYALKSEVPKSASDVGADASGTAESKVSEHNVSDTAHNDIRLLIDGLTTRLNALADSDDTTIDQMSEVVAYIKSNKSLIDAITTSKVNVSDIIDNLTTNVSNKPLSAAQGVALKALIDAITIPDTLPNPNALTFTGAVTGSYDGSTSLSVNIPSAVTDDHINELINTALNAIGVAEEGVY